MIQNLLPTNRYDGDFLARQKLNVRPVALDKISQQINNDSRFENVLT